MAFLLPGKRPALAWLENRQQAFELSNAVALKGKTTGPNVCCCNSVGILFEPEKPFPGWPEGASRVLVIACASDIEETK